MPSSTVIPVLIYLDVDAAVEWLWRVFGFTLRLRIGSHRAQLSVGDGAIVVAEGRGAEGYDSVMVRVDDVEAHYARSLENSAHILAPSMEYPYGERQYTVEDLVGRSWTFSQSIADVDPADWGGTLVSGGVGP
jgi:uncharacterized glyoxalase superfamily protein PhnB